ncbi:MAG: calcium-binding protein, partial [Methylococcaceae bacterium]|nr:calcium-binding protein [Methylococcaceae bacterium]
GGGLSFSTSAVVTSEAGTSASFTLMLNSQPDADVTVNLSGVDDTEGEILTGNSLTFNPDNWNQPRLVILQGLDDPLVDGDIRYTLTASGQSNDIRFNNKLARLSVVNTDNDAGGITLSASSLVTSEKGDSASFSAVLGSRPLSPVNIVVTGLDETEGALSQTSLSFDATNWNQAQTITVKGLDDTLADGDIPYELAVTSLSSDPNYNAKAFTVKVTNLDNEVGGIVVDKSQITTSEYLTSDNFSVALKSQPLSDVTVNISGLDTTEGRLSINSLSFSNTNWNIPQAVTVTGVEDNLYDGKIRYTLTLTSTGDAAYDGKNAKTAKVDVSNLDNFLKVEDITVNEGSPYSVFRVYGSEGQQL